jgi:GrpB-like predicted nucleotidyltransferase (UPF0157 family)
MIFLPAEEYQPNAQKLFLLVSDILKEELKDVRIEHIGSSAITGAISKGDLDIFVGVKKENFKSVLESIQSLGFTIKEGTLRTESLCMLTTPIFHFDVAVQLVENGSECENFIRFRDQLNADPALVQKYNALKTQCTGLSADEYRVIKSKFIEEVLGNLT